MYQRALRLPSRVLVHVRTQSTCFDATVGNLSATGARLLGVPDDGVRVGEVVTISAQGQTVLAQVRWHFDDTCGLMFKVPLQSGEIAGLLASRMAG